jgi:MFS transporter, DHA1 family, inner membrane transport protein
MFTSLAHGAFFGVGSMVAASVVPPDKRAGAVATIVYKHDVAAQHS